MIPGGPVETLFLDAGGVLVEPDWERIAGILADHGVGTDAAALARHDPAVRRELDVPATIRTTDDRRRGSFHLPRVLRRAGVEVPGEVLERACGAVFAEHARRNVWTSVPPGVPGALRALREAGLGLVVVSNADGKLLSAFRRIGLAGLFDHVVDSGALGVEKPDPAIFREALRVSGARPATTVHAGDYYEIDVVGARAAGLRAVLVDPAGVQGDRDCPRFPSLPALAEALLEGA